MTEEASVLLKLKGLSCISTFRFIREHILDVMRNELERTTTDTYIQKQRWKTGDEL